MYSTSTGHQRFYDEPEVAVGQAARQPQQALSQTVIRQPFNTFFAQPRVVVSTLPPAPAGKFTVGTFSPQTSPFAVRAPASVAFKASQKATGASSSSALVEQKPLTASKIATTDNDEHIYYIPDFDQDKKKAIKTLVTVTIVCLLFMATEVVGGLIANSLAIMTDAAHLFSDVSGFFISIISLRLSQTPPDKRMSYGYSRAEVLGALSSVILIWVLTVWLISEAVDRVITPPVIDAEIMLIIACLALLFNLAMMKILHGGHGHDHGHDHDHGHSHGEGEDHDHKEKKDKKKKKEHKHGDEKDKKDKKKRDHDHDHESGKGHDHGHDHDHDHGHDDEHAEESDNLNIRAVFIHLLGDTIQSIGVIIAALIIYFGGQKYAIADPICTFIFSVLVVFTTVPIMRDCLRILMEGTPIDIDLDKFKGLLLKVEGVQSVHDLHIWTIAPGRFAISAHIISTQPSLTLRKATELCKSKKIYHSTLQIENPNDSALYNAQRCEAVGVC